jgi:F420-non-reducing hydrogenase small subunit
MYWSASCGGCEIALVNIHEKILDVDAAFEFVFCPCLLDTKRKDIEAMPDGEIAVTMFNGAIRTGENEEMAHLMRRKSGLLIAFGACASGGSIPGLSNLYGPEETFRTVYLENPTIDNPGGVLPVTRTVVPEGGELEIPTFYDRVRTLGQVTEVDYYIPDCPPEPHQILAVIEAVVSGGPLPERGSVIGAGNSSVCEECEKRKQEKKVKEFQRLYEIVPDPEVCLLEQGIICMGIATRDGCGALCPKVNMPCTGCYGPPEGVMDQGAKMVAALGSILDIGPRKGMSEEELNRRTDALLDAIPDFAGMFYKYSLPGSILGGRASS